MNNFELNSAAEPSDDGQATNELSDCFDDFNIDFFAHLNNSTELIRKDNPMLHYHTKLKRFKRNTTPRRKSTRKKQQQQQEQLHHLQQQRQLQITCCSTLTSTNY